MKSSSCIFPLLILYANISCVVSWCHPDKRTDNPHGRCCVFPFVYGGKTYNSCTKVAHHRLWCSLDKVYRGHWANCVNPCTNNPCQNGGVCTVVGDDFYSCKCAEEYFGNNCEKVSPCKSRPCKNGGTCTMSGPDSFFCTCTDEFEGETCEKRLPCPPGKKTDNQHGRCCVFPFVYGGKKYESCTKVAHNRLWCSLDKVYKGHWANCVNPCTNNPCRNGGVCTVTGDDTYSCTCAEGYFGNNCEKVSPCKSRPCKNGGTCTTFGTDFFFCSCADEFEGDTCEKRLPCPSGKKTDNPHGRCCVFPFVYGGKKYESCTKVAHHKLWCSLDKVYKGHWANCVNPCTNNPCQNGGVCTVVGDDFYSCLCAEEYFGNNCEKVSPCKSRPCKNGGTCTMSGPDSFFCTCTDEFEGETCEKRLPCPPGKKTDNRHGRCCVFPFVYGGKKYESCTKVAHNRLWCSLDKVYKGHWANCGLPCPPGKKTDNQHGRCCVFPFVYGGKKYESCTKVAHNRLWCSLDKVYKGHWANCSKQ